MFSLLWVTIKYNYYQGLHTKQRMSLFRDQSSRLSLIVLFPDATRCLPSTVSGSNKSYADLRLVLATSYRLGCTGHAPNLMRGSSLTHSLASGFITSCDSWMVLYILIVFAWLAGYNNLSIIFHF